MLLDDRVSRNTITAYRNLDGEGLVMNPSDSMLHSLNEVGCAIWEALAEPKAVRDLVAVVLGQFDCDQATAERDVIEFLAALQAQGLVKVQA